MSVESFQQPKRKAYKGRCMVIVKSEKVKGEIILTAKSNDLPDAKVTLISN
jgi:beta-galactosidase